MKKKLLLFVFILFYVNSPLLLFSQFKIFDGHSGYFVNFIPAISQNSSGQFVIAWSDFRHIEYFGDGTGEEEVYAQIYDKDLKPVGENIRVPEQGLADFNDVPSVSMNDSNKIIIAFNGGYHGSDDGLENGKIFYKKYNGDGEALSQSIRVDETDSTLSFSFFYAYWPIAILFNNGNYVINFGKNYYGDDKYVAIKSGRYLQFYDSEDQKIGHNILLEKFGVVILRKLDEHRFAIVIDNRYFEIYSDQFELLQPWTDMGENPDFELPDIIQVYNDSTFIFQYGGYEVSFRLFNFYTSEISKKYMVHEDNSGFLYGWFDSARGANGELVIVWTDTRNFFRGTDDYTDIYAQIYDKNLQKIGDNFKLNHEEREYSQYWPAVFPRGESFLTIWTEFQRHPTCTGDPDTTTTGMHNTIAGIEQEFANPVPGEILGLDDLFRFCTGYPTFLARQNYPNPFNHTTNIDFKIFKDAVVNISVYNILGQKIMTLLNENLKGDPQFGTKHHILLKMPDEAASGLYFIRLSAFGESQILKTLYLK